jgi:NAD(P)-dependent dehydrogenase (short-subunit alcohol dehydrogenase family)
LRRGGGFLVFFFFVRSGTREADERGGWFEYSAKEVFDTFNTNVFGTFNVARAAIPYLREAAAARGPGQTAALATFGSLGSWWSGAAVAHCKFSSLPQVGWL